MCFYTATYRYQSFLSFCDRDGRQRSIPSDPFCQIEWREYNLLFLEGLSCGKRVRPMSISFNSHLKRQQIHSIYHIKTIFVLASIDFKSCVSLFTTFPEISGYHCSYHGCDWLREVLTANHSQRRILVVAYHATSKMYIAKCMDLRGVARIFEVVRRILIVCDWTITDRRPVCEAVGVARVHGLELWRGGKPPPPPSRRFFFF